LAAKKASFNMLGIWHRHWSVCAGTIAWPHASIEALKAAQ
jgi:hypothetical protein